MSFEWLASFCAMIDMVNLNFTTFAVAEAKKMTDKIERSLESRVQRERQDRGAGGTRN